MSKKERLDQYLVALHPQLSRTTVQSLIEEGMVRVNGTTVTKPGTKVGDQDVIELKELTPKFVSRAGLKLEAALKEFEINAQGMVVLDAGLSTGGFTDCLLQHGAQRVYGIDVGHGQTHEKIKNDPRVIVMEGINLRYLESLPEKVDLATLDVSFISLLKVIPAVIKQLKDEGFIIALIKPQFEAQRKDFRKETVVQNILQSIRVGMADYGFEMKNLIPSPILGGDGNKEFLALFKRTK